ncbi:hypothetical protein CTAYLR_005084 [Chrysophaeum taylorii]|uniref:Uncharacterized protein n=1 Tax=Chrysophaeum taylorii TaxID=2483200 RepID=A0AAD7UAC6_9STRA|nr:hypothetical protein CTAYLR_005084 [Chrysophaeum taylorii]
MMLDLRETAPSVRAGMWLQREVRENVRRAVIELVETSRGRTRAEAIASKLDTAWRASLSDRAGLGEFLEQAEALSDPNGRRRLAPSIVPEEPRDAKIRRIAEGRPAPFMRWPEWAAQPWLGAPDAAVEAPADKWRRVDDRAAAPRYSYVVKASDEVRALAEEKARVALGIDDDDELGQPSELLELERLLAAAAETTEPTPRLARVFAVQAAERRSPAFFGRSTITIPDRIKRVVLDNREEPLFDDDVDLGPDADVLDPPAGIEAILHGRFRRAGLARGKQEHIILVPRALAVAGGRLHVLYNCRITLPLCWLDSLDETEAPRPPSLPPPSAAPVLPPPPGEDDEEAATARLLDMLDADVPEEGDDFAILGLQAQLQPMLRQVYDAMAAPR